MPITRTPFIEQPDGSLVCTLTISADAIAAFIATGIQAVKQPEPAAPGPAEKPPAQRMAVNGFEAFGPMKECEGFDIRALASHAPFQRYVESNMPLDDGGDSVSHALAYITGTQDMAALIHRYRVWHSERWPGESALPGSA